MILKGKMQNAGRILYHLTAGYKYKINLNNDRNIKAKIYLLKF